MKLIIGIGIPGSGKSTYLKPLSHELNYEYINADEIRAELTGNATNHTQEAQVWSLVHERLQKALEENGVILDATFTKRRDRREAIKIAQAVNTSEIIAYWFKIPLEVCLERNSKRERKVPEAVLRKMHARLLQNPPKLEEGFSEIRVIEV